ncbi:hypothetical protein QJS10_CPB22g01245 [Acorus calamus]|uniref:Vacuolar protein sorting-associated protein 62 n=1 Tax=Acorus calamus TaxID=4465 RepID=A0AAV9C0N9_ACOCL|nr:hypothetical protein QJS10_CPB22g01245 [Acorus calamus]
MGSSLSLSKRSRRRMEPLPIETLFKLPSPIPSWPPGGGFAKGTMDLGGLEVTQATTFTKVWSALEGGPDNLGATFFRPSTPDGFSLLGYYCQPNNKSFSGWALVARAIENGALAPPTDYTLVWSSQNPSKTIKQDGTGYVWLPLPPEGYNSVGYVVTGSPDKPSFDEVRCVRSDFTEQSENESSVWATDGFNVYNTRPVTRGTQATGVPVGTFSAITPPTVVSLKNKAFNSYSCMPNMPQIQALMKAYAPWIYFHPDERYFPSSVNWYFKNGARLHQKDSGNAVPIDPDGSNLPQGGSNDGLYWLDLDGKAREAAIKGDLGSAESYLHVKPMLGGAFTDVAVWVFYPFNGPARAKVGPINVGLGRIGEHVGDWEHVTLRVSNLNGELRRVYYSEHSAGSWVEASDAEFKGEGNNVAAYASQNGHAFYPKAGLVLQGPSGGVVGIRNDAARGKYGMDTGERFSVVAAEHLGEVVVAPGWLDYRREWGPKIDYDVDKEVGKVVRFLPGKVREKVEKLVKGLPSEVLGEEGPTGPKMKRNWDGDEI